MVEFCFEPTGDEVVVAFPEQVKGRICESRPSRTTQPYADEGVMKTGPSWESIGAETVLALAKGFPGMVISQD